MKIRKDSIVSIQWHSFIGVMEHKLALLTTEIWVLRGQTVPEHDMLRG